VAIARVREEWVVTALDVLERGTGLRPWRRAAHLRVPWEQVAGLEPSESAERRVAALANLRPADLAAALQALPAQAQREVVADLDDDRLAAALEELPEEVQAVLLGGLDDERAADVLEAMDPDDAADLLGELPEADRARLLLYDEETAGGLMTTEPVIMRTSDTVAEALARLRDPDLPPALAGQAFVVRAPTQTPTGRYLGVAYLQRLLREAPGEELGACLDTDLDCLAPEVPTRRVAEYLASYDLLAAPICDPQGRLLGAVSIDDVLDHLLPEAWRRGAVRAPEGSGEPRGPEGFGGPQGGPSTRRAPVNRASGGAS
jgi:Mg/Co/Ni transporter MgtE